MMITVRLAGGLGNQIFQFAATLLYASEKYDIILDTYGMSKYESKHVNELMNFFDFTKYEKEIIENKSYISRTRLAKLFAFKIPNWPLIGDKNFEYTRKFKYQKNIFLDGYFQDGLVQEDFDREIMLLRSLLIKKDIKVDNADTCIIHIRGGDFVRLGWNSVTPKEYYEHAISYIQTDRTKFYIVTDDRDYARKTFDEIGIDYEIIGNDIVDDFFLIGKYKKRILSSSTFSFWASALGYNEESVVIAPSYWTPGRKRKIMLPNEIRLENF